MENKKDHQDTPELLEQLGSGSHSAFSLLFNRYKHRVYSNALLFTTSTNIAEEIVQDVFLQIWKSREKVAAVTDWDAYLFIITRNAVYRSLHAQAQQSKKHKAWQEQTADTEHEDNLLSTILEKDYNRLLQRAIQQLPPQQLQVYVLIRQQGLSRAEAADRLGLQPETVKRHLSLATRTIRSYCLLHLDLTPAIALLICMQVR
ncbi:sigma-70 family RNA polymerase sigma factor [Pseudoflavitalea sp. G-6-1-2]|uniref:sigma-70 family RNA polymerase sigma factor n=1 Tax=Pseudoflavitalea sp. G-6-1-2 TaxID=2728841 RepID=UPI00146A6F11|nr:sigma-70 family RNA polymerase sigma factor [Pseudoflavitalea sp. G-6-1-2]NML23561.1 sigma-70 family RNA polymerase sigma factor [Pseudoflavitalea sp. G-6-1-2]